MRAAPTTAWAVMLALCLAAYAPDLGARGPTEPAPRARVDPLPGPSLGIGATGVGLAATGVVLLATAEGEEVCTALSGCIHRSAEGTQRDAGTLLLGGGAALALVGGGSWLSTRAAPLGADEERDAPGAAVTGLALTAVGGGALGAGLVLGGAGRDEADFGRAAPLLAGGAVFTAVGLPLWLIGASHEGPEERRAEALDDQRRARRRDDDRRRRADLERRAAAGDIPTRAASPGLAATGGTLTGLGLAGCVVSTVVATTGDGGGSSMSFDGLERTLGAAAGIGVSSLFIVTGGVLFTVGMRQVPDESAADDAPTPAAIPTAVEVGPARMSATWVF